MIVTRGESSFLLKIISDGTDGRQVDEAQSEPPQHSIEQHQHRDVHGEDGKTEGYGGDDTPCNGKYYYKVTLGPALPLTCYADWSAAKPIDQTSNYRS